MDIVVDWNNLSTTAAFAMAGTRGRSARAVLWKAAVFQPIIEAVSSAPKDVDVRLVVAVDSGVSWRRDVLPGYRATRDSGRLDEEVRQQVRELSEEALALLASASAYVLREEGLEADDIVGAWCRHHCRGAVVVSNDSDLVQLLRYPGVELYVPRKELFVGRGGGRTRKGIGRILEITSDGHIRPKGTGSGKGFPLPMEWWEFSVALKVVRGDRSDNIPSVRARVRTDRLLGIWAEGGWSALEAEFGSTREEAEAFRRNRMLVELGAEPPDVHGRLRDLVTGANLPVLSGAKCVEIERAFDEFLPWENEARWRNARLYRAIAVAGAR